MRLIACLHSVLTVLLPAVALATYATEAQRPETAAVGAKVEKAFDSGSSRAIAELFPEGRKVRATLDQIADLKGYVGVGPLVEGFRRYLDAHTESRFRVESAGEAHRDAEALRVRGTLSARDAEGRRTRVPLVFVFEIVGGDWRCVEVRETG